MPHIDYFRPAASLEVAISSVITRFPATVGISPPGTLTLDQVPSFFFFSNLCSGDRPSPSSPSFLRAINHYISLIRRHQRYSQKHALSTPKHGTPRRKNFPDLRQH